MSAHGRGEAAGGERVLTHLFFSANAEAHDRTSGGSLLLSILLHALLLLLAVGPIAQHHLKKTELDPGVGTGIGAGPAGGGGGGREEITLVDLTSPPLPAPAAEQVVPPPPPPPELQVPQLEFPDPKLAMTDVRADTLPSAVTAGAVAGGGQGPGQGTGRGAGTGPGSGGGSGGGTGGGIGSGVGPGIGRGRLMSPVPDFVLLPPPQPRSVSGKTVVVRLAIDAVGVVHEVELIPPTGDRGFDQALRRTAMGWRFRPARDAANQAVAVNYDITFSF